MRPGAPAAKLGVKPAPPHWSAAAGVFLCVAGTALFFDRDLELAFTFAKLLVLCAGVWLTAAGLAASGRAPFIRTSLDAPLAACLLVTAVSAAFSTDRWLSLLGAEAYSYGLWATAVLAAVYWLAAPAVRGRELRLLKLALAAYGLAGFYAVLQAAGLDPLKDMPELPQGRAYSTFGSPFALGEAMTLMLPLALYWVRERRGELAGWLCLAAMTGGLAASISRGAWLSAAVACAAYLAVGGGADERATPRRLAPAIAAALILASGIVWGLRRRAFPAGDGGRTLIWRSAWELFEERPVLGWGTNSFVLTSRLKRTPEAIRLSSIREIPAHAHDDLLHALATTGALGLAAYLWLWGALAAACARAARDPERPWAPALACGLLGLFLNMKVNPAPIEVLAGAAFFAALLTDRRPFPAAAGRAAPLAALAAASASLLLAGRLAAAQLAARSAERRKDEGRVDLAAREAASAARLNPWELRYRLAYVNALAAYSARLQPPSDENRALLEAALRSALEAVSLHPRDPDAHYAEGIARLNLAYLEPARSGRLGDLEPARLALDRALALDATYLPTILARRVIAEAQKDERSAAELTRRAVLINAAPGEALEAKPFTRP